MSVGYPSSSAALPIHRLRSPSGETARTLVLLGLVLQVVGGLVVLAAIGWFFGFSLLHPYPFAGFAVTGAVLVGVLVVLFLYFAYTRSYQRIQRGEYGEAQTPTLVLAALSLCLGVVPGLFYLFGYFELGEAAREQRAPAPGPAPPTFGAAAIACRACGRVFPLGAYTFCPNCGQKLGG